MLPCRSNEFPVWWNPNVNAFAEPFFHGIDGLISTLDQTIVGFADCLSLISHRRMSLLHFRIHIFAFIPFPTAGCPLQLSPFKNSTNSLFKSCFRPIAVIFRCLNEAKRAVDKGLIWSVFLLTLSTNETRLLWMVLPLLFVSLIIFWPYRMTMWGRLYSAFICVRLRFKVTIPSQTWNVWF